MKKKRIAQYCCAALVAAGIGLNIQNAIADYGIDGNTFSLVATTGAAPVREGWCSYVNLSPSTSHAVTSDPLGYIGYYNPDISNSNSNGNYSNSNGNYSNSNGNYSNSNGAPRGTKEDRDGTVNDCGGNSGQWRLSFFIFEEDRHEQLVGKERLTYYKYVDSEFTEEEVQEDGTTKKVTYLMRTCTEYEANSNGDYSDCPSPGGLVIEPK
jgi:hypothetical protein